MTDDTQPGKGNYTPFDFDPPSAEELTATLEGYEVLAFLAKGSMGTVYKASQPHLDRLVALKILPARTETGARYIERFQREAQTMARLRHDHIMTIHDFGETTDGKFIYIAMEWVEGTTLERAILQENFSQRHILAIVTQICDALQYAHEHGVVHRDIKPANVMLDDNGQVKIADFGLAQIVGTETYDNKLTHSTASIGLPDFVAPEQLEPGHKIDHRADIYSIGVILYKMLTGYTPRGTFLPPSRKVEGLDPRLDEIVATAMAADPENRYPQISQMWQDVEAVHNQPITAAQTTAPSASQLITGSVTERAAPKLVTGKVPEKAPAEIPVEDAAGPEAALKEPAAPEIQSDKAVKITVLALVGSFALILLIVAVGFILSQDDSGDGNTDNESEAVVASVPQPEKKSEAEPEQRTVKIRRENPDPTPPPRPPEMTTPPPPAPPPAAETVSLPPGKTLDLPAVADPTITGAPTPPATPAPVNPTESEPLGEVIAWTRSGSEEDVSLLGDRPPGFDRVIAIAAPDKGAAGVLALLDDGTVSAWFDPKAGGPLAIFRDIPPNLTGVIAIGAGNAHALALKGDGTVVSWGKPGAPQTIVPEGLDRVVAISVGFFHNLALRDDGTVAVWGNNGFGQLDMPPGLVDVVAIEAGGAHSLAHKADGSFVTWGRNDYGQATVPENLGKVVAFDSIAEDSYFLTADGRLEHRGRDEDVIPSTLENIAQFHIGRAFLAAQSRDGEWQTYGNNFDKKRARDHLADAARVVVPNKYLFAFVVDPAPVAAASIEKEGTPDASGSAPKLPGEAGPSPEPPADDPLGEIEQRIAELLASFQDRYEQSIGAAHRGEVAKLNTQYLAAIGRAEKIATAAGNLDVVLALRGESEAITKAAGDLALLAELPANPPKSLQDLRGTYAKQLAKLEAARDADAAPLLATYDKALEKLQGEFTRSMKIDEAVAVKTTREKLREESPFTPGAKGLDAPLAAEAIPAGKKTASTTLPELPEPLAYPPTRPTVTGGLAGWDLAGNVFQDYPQELMKVHDIVDFDSGVNFGAALRSDGTVLTWYYEDPKKRQPVPGGLAAVVDIATSDRDVLALKADGTVVAWSKSNDVEVALPDRLRNVSAVAAGTDLKVALRRNGSLRLWGGWLNPQSIQDAEKAYQLVKVQPGGGGYSLGLREDGKVKILFDETLAGKNLPKEVHRMVENLDGVIDIAVNVRGRQSLAVLNTGEVVAWGWGTEEDPGADPLPPDLPKDIDKVVVGRAGMAAAHSRSGDWIFFGPGLDADTAEKHAARAARCIDIQFGWDRIWGLRPVPAP